MSKTYHLLLSCWQNVVAHEVAGWADSCADRPANAVARSTGIARIFPLAREGELERCLTASEMNADEKQKVKS